MPYSEEAGRQLSFQARRQLAFYAYQTGSLGCYFWYIHCVFSQMHLVVVVRLDVAVCKKFARRRYKTGRKRLLNLCAFSPQPAVYGSNAALQFFRLIGNEAEL